MFIFTETTNQSSQAKPHKRRVLLLKRKAVTTGIFDSKGKDDFSNKGPYMQIAQINHTFFSSKFKNNLHLQVVSYLAYHWSSALKMITIGRRRRRNREAREVLSVRCSISSIAIVRAPVNHFPHLKRNLQNICTTHSYLYRIPTSIAEAVTTMKK
jgi:hypothetical protein